MAKILFHCVNGTGLGHITRTLAVIRQVKRLAPDSEILVLTSSEHAGLLWQEGIASVKVPSFEVLQADQRIPVVQLSHAIVAQTVAIFRPDAIVTESQPTGMFSEFFSSLLSVRKRIFIFGRFPNYLSNSYYRLGLQVFGRVIMPYHEHEKELVGVDFGDRAVWVGDMFARSADELLPRDEARRRLKLPAERLVCYVGLGGGGNPQNNVLLNWVLDTLTAFKNLEIVYARQPLAPCSADLEKRERVKSIAHFPMLEYFNAFDLAISAAGFNCGELVHAGVPAIWVPLGPPSTDQEFNAGRFAQRGLGFQVTPFDTTGLRDAVERLAEARCRGEMSEKMRAFCPCNGAERAAWEILCYLGTGSEDTTATSAAL